MTVTNAPIIFIHYGDAPYLRYTLRAATRFHPDRPVVLLGDSDNSHYERIGVRHVLFDQYDRGDRVVEFNRVYRLVAGADFARHTHGVKWARFNFLKWFVLDNFVAEHEYDRFWTFDTDTLLLRDLGPVEARYRTYDCTEHLHGVAIQGFVANREVLRGYLGKINELFSRPDYLQEMKDDFVSHPTHGFTMMRAYATYKREVPFRSLSLSAILENETFDGCLMMSQEMEPNEHTVHGRLPKKVYLGRGGRVFYWHVPSARFVRVNAVNLSWVPLHVFSRLFHHVASSPAIESAVSEPNLTDLFPMSWKEPRLFYLRRMVASARHQIRRALSGS